jgi:phenylpropionate dioxygenase-like ring-hydroxylating dioxygenase large terminal subunit
MLSREDNERLTRIGRGTPMGELMRRYWIPVAFSKQIEAPDSPPIRVKLLGEKLVAFRDTMGRVGLVAEACPHRTASMFFGRNEECGLRCVYHGWKFDITGACVDMPSEPEGSNFRTKVRITAYPCEERGGMIWAYMGDAARKPAFPRLEWAHLPADQVYVTRHVQECNWLQGVEGGFDTSHLAFLHKGTESEAARPPQSYHVVPIAGGFAAGSIRAMVEGEQRYTTSNFLLPFHKLIATRPWGAHIWMPVDDETTMLYSVYYNPERALSTEDMRRALNFEHIHPENIPGSDRAKANRDNDYLIDRSLQASGKSFTGIYGVGVQDCGIQESMGPIADRTIEHLGVSDTAIIKLRKFLLDTLADVDAGKEPPGLEAEAAYVRPLRQQPAGQMGLPEAIAAFGTLGAKAAAAE